MPQKKPLEEIMHQRIIDFETTQKLVLGRFQQAVSTLPEQERHAVVETLHHYLDGSETPTSIDHPEILRCHYYVTHICQALRRYTLTYTGFQLESLMQAWFFLTPADKARFDKQLESGVSPVIQDETSIPTYDRILQPIRKENHWPDITAAANSLRTEQRHLFQTFKSNPIFAQLAGGKQQLTTAQKEFRNALTSVQKNALPAQSLPQDVNYTDNLQRALQTFQSNLATLSDNPMVFNIGWLFLTARPGDQQTFLESLKSCENVRVPPQNASSGR